MFVGLSPLSDFSLSLSFPLINLSNWFIPKTFMKDFFCQNVSKAFLHLADKLSSLLLGSCISHVSLIIIKLQS